MRRSRVDSFALMRCEECGRRVYSCRFCGILLHVEHGEPDPELVACPDCFSLTLEFCSKEAEKWPIQ